MDDPCFREAENTEWNSGGTHHCLSVIEDGYGPAILGLTRRNPENPNHRSFCRCVAACEEKRSANH